MTKYTLSAGAITTTTDVKIISSTHSTLSKEERAELDQLEKDLEQWKRQQKILKFQELPAEIRQDIVNESMVKDKYREMQNIDESKFDNYTRLKELHYKDGLSVIFSNHMYDLHSSVPIWKYPILLNIFTTEELSEAHAAATLEEQLNDDNN